MRRTKVIATVGPACADPAAIRQLLDAGMDVARINLSHGELGQLRTTLTNLRAAERETGRLLAVMLDTSGPEVRVVGVPDGGLDLKAGDTVTLGSEGQATLSPSWMGALKALRAGSRVLLDDGNIVLRVRDVGPPAYATVVSGGHLVNHKKFSCPGDDWDLDVLTDFDRQALAVGLELGIDWVAASFVRSAEDVFVVRRYLEDCDGGDVPIMAKIENARGVDRLEEIVRASDGIMVARGDLGVELPVEEIPGLQKDIISRACSAGKPVVTATQMLESMVQQGRPTRAEVTDVANAIWDGSDAVMLSAETAVGRDPARAVQTMARIAEIADNRMAGAANPRHAPPMEGEMTVTQALSHATVAAAVDLGARAIITATESGHTALAVARQRPPIPILAATPRVAVARRLKLVWGVEPLLMEAAQDTDDMMAKVVHVGMQAGRLEPGDMVVLTAGVPVGQPGTTNLLRVLTIGEAILRGQGVGPERAATGEVVVVEDVRAWTPRQLEGKVLVAARTDRHFVPLMERAHALIVEEAGLTSHAAIAGLSLGKPTVVGARDAMKRLSNGQVVTVDGYRGLVFQGQAKI